MTTRRYCRILEAAALVIVADLVVRCGFWVSGTAAPSWLVWHGWPAAVLAAGLLVEKHVPRVGVHVVTRAEAAERLRAWRESRESTPPE